MAPTLLDRLDGLVVDGATWPRPSILDPPAPPRGGEPTLDAVLVSAWEGLAAERTAPCPVCRGRLEPRFGAGSGPVAGRCADCGTELE